MPDTQPEEFFADPFDFGRRSRSPLASARLSLRPADGDTSTHRLDPLAQIDAAGYEDCARHPAFMSMDTASERSTTRVDPNAMLAFVPFILAIIIGLAFGGGDQYAGSLASIAWLTSSSWQGRYSRLLD